jgi:PASTA domain
MADDDLPREDPAPQDPWPSAPVSDDELPLDATREELYGPTIDQVPPEPVAADQLPDVDDPAATRADPPPVAPGGTSVLPVVPVVPDVPPTPPRWSARAQVPTPGVEEESDEPEWAPAPDRPRRDVFGPALIAIVALILLGVLGIGVYLLLRGNSDGSTDEVPPNPVGTATPTHTSAAPKTTKPGPTATTAAAMVAVPRVRGKTYAAAADQLTRAGLVPVRSDETSDELPAGQVIGTDPPENNQVPPGTTITVDVSTGPPPSPTAAPTTAPPPATPTA